MPVGVSVAGRPFVGYAEDAGSRHTAVGRCDAHEWTADSGERPVGYPVRLRVPAATRCTVSAEAAVRTVVSTRACGSWPSGDRRPPWSGASWASSWGFRVALRRAPRPGDVRQGCGGGEATWRTKTGLRCFSGSASGSCSQGDAAEVHVEQGHLTGLEVAARRLADALRGKDVTLRASLLAHGADDPHRSAVDHRLRVAEVSVPVGSVGRWYDLFLRGTAASRRSARRGGTRSPAQGRSVDTHGDGRLRGGAAQIPGVRTRPCSWRPAARAHPYAGT